MRVGQLAASRARRARGSSGSAVARCGCRSSTSSPSRNTMQRKPSHFGSKSQVGALRQGVERAHRLRQHRLHGGTERQLHRRSDYEAAIGTSPDFAPATLGPAMAEHPLSERLEQLNKRKEEALNAGSEAARHRQHDRGKMLARERVEYLLDPGSFHELDLLARHRGCRRPPTGPTPTASSPVGAPSTVARSSSSARTSRSSAARSARCSPRRSTS